MQLNLDVQRFENDWNKDLSFPRPIFFHYMSHYRVLNRNRRTYTNAEIVLPTRNFPKLLECRAVNFYCVCGLFSDGNFQKSPQKNKQGTHCYMFVEKKFIALSIVMISASFQLCLAVKAQRIKCLFYYTKSNVLFVI